jgi:hypothetical protein
MLPQSQNKPTSNQQTSIVPAGRLLVALAVMSYAFWLLHSFAIRNSLSAIHQLLSKSGLNP